MTTATRPKRRYDLVTSELAMEVFERDGRCFGEWAIPGHICRTRQTVDHVHWHAGGTKGRRAPSRREHLVRMCDELNTGAPSRELRQKERGYLRSLYPAHGTETGCVCDAL